jgi:hypothetical protein
MNELTKLPESEAHKPRPRVIPVEAYVSEDYAPTLPATWAPARRARSHQQNHEVVR